LAAVNQAAMAALVVTAALVVDSEQVAVVLEVQHNPLLVVLVMVTLVDQQQEVLVLQAAVALVGLVALQLGQQSVAQVAMEITLGQHGRQQHLLELADIMQVAAEAQETFLVLLEAVAAALAVMLPLQESVEMELQILAVAAEADFRAQAAMAVQV
jgi:hypothetical protein